MGANRVFFPQRTLDAWLEQSRAWLVGDELTLAPEGRRFRLTTALHFLAEVAGTSDPHGLVGKVKTREQLAEIEGEHYADSVIVGDSAYQVVEGFTGVPLPAIKLSARRSLASAKGLEAADENDSLSRLLRQM